MAIYFYDYQYQFVNLQIIVNSQMFLSKKTATLTNKNKTKTHAQKPLGGWGDDDNTDSNQFGFSNFQIKKNQEVQIYKPQPQQSVDLLDAPMAMEIKKSFPKQQSKFLAKTKSQPQKKIYFDWDELNEMNDIQIQKKLVEDIVEPGGVRIKPNQTILSQFFKEAKVLNITAIGSLLLSKLQVNYPFQIKARSLYVIEYLVKKSEQYSVYFKIHNQKIANFPEPQDNIQNYKKILSNVLNVIGMQTSVKKEEEEINYVDPGYNDKKVSDLKNFLDKNQKKKGEGKKKLISPLQAKKLKDKDKDKKEQKKQEVDLLDIGQQRKKSDEGFVDLLSDSKQTSKRETKDIKFDDLMGKEVKAEKGEIYDLIL